jgi:hypothetical protein
MGVTSPAVNLIFHLCRTEECSFGHDETITDQEIDRRKLNFRHFQKLGSDVDGMGGEFPFGSVLSGHKEDLERGKVLRGVAHDALATKATGLYRKEQGLVVERDGDRFAAHEGGESIGQGSRTNGVERTH